LKRRKGTERRGEERKGADWRGEEWLGEGRQKHSGDKRTIFENGKHVLDKGGNYGRKHNRSTKATESSAFRTAGKSV